MTGRSIPRGARTSSAPIASFETRGALRRARVLEAVPVVLGRYLEHARERSAQPLDRAEPAVTRDFLQLVARFLEAAAGQLDAKALNELRGRRAGVLAEDAGKVPRAHAGL